VVGGGSVITRGADTAAALAREAGVRTPRVYHAGVEGVALGRACCCFFVRAGLGGSSCGAITRTSRSEAR
jgi:hypothetical protein